MLPRNALRYAVVVSALALVAPLGCKRKSKTPQTTVQHIVKKKKAADLEAAKKSFDSANGGGWTVTVDEFTGFVTAASRKPPEERAKAFPMKGAVLEGKKFLSKNAAAFGFTKELLDSDALSVGGTPGGKAAPNEFLILISGTTHFPHPKFDAYDLGDRVKVKLVIRHDGVLKVESEAPLPDPNLPDKPAVMWSDAKIKKKLGGKEPAMAPEQLVHVVKGPDAITYKIAWKVKMGEKVRWFDANTGEELTAPTNG